MPDRRRTLVHARLEYIEGNLEGVLKELELIEAQLGPEDAELRSEMLGWRSRTCWLTGRWEEAFSSANAAVAALDGLPESPQLARALARRSQIEMLKHHDDAIGHAEEAIAVARRVDDLFAEVNARINLFTEQATRGIGLDPDELLDIVDRATEAGVYDEAYRAIVNFLWSAPGFIPLDEAERVSAEARRQLGDVTPPSSIAAYVELSKVHMLSYPAGRWHEVDEVIRADRAHSSSRSPGSSGCSLPAGWPCGEGTCRRPGCGSRSCDRWLSRRESRSGSSRWPAS